MAESTKESETESETEQDNSEDRDRDSELEAVIDALISGDEEDDEDNADAEDALLAVCVAAHNDKDFGKTAVEQVLKTLGMEEFWKASAELAEAIATKE